MSILYAIILLLFIFVVPSFVGAMIETIQKGKLKTW